MKRLLLILFLFLLAPQAHAAISFDSNTDVSANSGSGVNITVNSGDTMLVVHGIDNSTNALTAVSATVGGNAMTQIGTIITTPNDEFMLYYLNPPTGTQSVVITETGGTAHFSRAALYKGTITSGWTPNFVEGHGSVGAGMSANITIGASTSWIVDGFRSDGTAQSGQSGTIRTPSTNQIFTMDTNGTVSSGSKTVSLTGGSGTWEWHIVEIPVPAAAAVTAPLFARGTGWW